MKNYREWRRNFAGFLPRKLMLIMKLTIGLFLLLGVQVLASGSYAQDARVSLKMKNARVKEVLQEIEKNSEFYFVYNNQLIDVEEEVDVEAESEKIRDILDKLFDEGRVSYTLLGKQIVLSPSEMGVDKLEQSQQQKKIITGSVTDVLKEPIPGATVVVKGTSKGTITDVDGNFSITVDKADAVLAFSFIGFKTREINIVGKNSIDVTLMEEVAALDEVVVVGYGTQKKSVLTGSISSVDLDGVESQQTGRIENVLQGRTSGVTIASSSGAPGASATIRIRGATSLNSGANNPLYIVDGVVVNSGSIDHINPDDIKSIEVLKDAASAAIYGARSSAGVILVTTKSGANRDGLRVSYNGYVGLQSPAKRIDLLDASEYATMVNEMYVNSSRRPLFDDPSSFGEGTDWQKEIFNNEALTQKHAVSISGGNDKSNFYTSVGYYDQEGVIATDISQYKRYNVRINTTHKIREWIKIGQTAGYTRVKNLGGVPENTQFGGPLSAAIMMDPITPVFETDEEKLDHNPYTNPNVVKTEDGRYYGISEYVSQQVYNPLAYMKTKEGNYGWSESLIGNAFIEINPVRDFIFKTSVGGRIANYGDETFSPTYYLNASVENINNSFNKTRTKNYNWNIENTLTYKKQLKKHNISFLAGQGAYVDNITSTLDVTYFNLPVNNHDDATMNYDVGNDNIIAYGNEGVLHTVSSLCGRVTYEFDEKYLFTG
ncbi:SusC/RagA family TonB-linked outer membrane protein, partial [Marinilabilia sp.]